MRALARALSAALVILTIGAFVEVPGPHRAILPGAFGLTEIAPGVFTDAPERTQATLSLIRDAGARSAAFFGETWVAPTWVVCARAACADTFAMSSLGLTIGYHYVLIAPRGLNAETMTHERIHVDLHSRMGPRDLLAPRFPTWFDEGLATHLSRPPPVRGRADAARADWVREATTVPRWTELRQARPADQLYTAAAMLVDELEDRLGRRGLQDFVAAVAGGADFDMLYTDAIGR